VVSGCKQAIRGDANTESANSKAASLPTDLTLGSVSGGGYPVQSDGFPKACILVNLLRLHRLDLLGLVPPYLFSVLREE